MGKMGKIGEVEGVIIPSLFFIENFFEPSSSDKSNFVFCQLPYAKIR